MLIYICVIKDNTRDVYKLTSTPHYLKRKGKKSEENKKKDIGNRKEIKSWGVMG